MFIFISIVLFTIGVLWILDAFKLFTNGNHRIKMPLLIPSKDHNNDTARQFNNELFFGLILLILGAFILSTSIFNPVQKVLFLGLCYLIIDLRGTGIKYSS